MSTDYTFYNLLHYFWFVLFLFRIQHGLGQFNLGDSQSYHLIYEPNSYCLKVVITQVTKELDLQLQIRGFKLFLELMAYLEDSIHSIMKLYIPSAELPVLHVVCPLCDTANPHIILENARNISLNFPLLCCAEKGAPEALLRSSYLPFGDTLTHQEFSK